MSWVESFEISAPFIDLKNDPERAAMLAKELSKEIVDTHPLAGRYWKVIAEVEPQDDVLATAEDETVLVHLTWSRKSETPPWPLHQFLGSAVELRDLLGSRY
ncbi:hypothetical protein G7068_01165 [Leucobacter viscericola]|uniref:Uncharacterized protein n=1 Tax=Leucobacter viscericola TaxID=2714935 RepID=A0A6G7XBI9_9MICO|nr:hypothetical protein [Leucobacter viscericola]QIK61970.1 hypothetical protein G7068_01165 [Leucobacter viscericola]